MTAKKDNESTPAAEVESAQGTPGEPATPAAGDLVHHESSDSYGIVIGHDDEGVPLVLWLGVAARCGLPLRRVG